jgi:hypothetical protein
MAHKVLWTESVGINRHIVGDTHPTQSGARVTQGLGGVRQKARASEQERFTTLLHHLTIDLLQESYYALERSAWSRRRELAAV